MKISFNPDLFNDIYWHLKEDLKNPLIRYIFLYGGSSASKTYTYVQSDITALLEFENENVMVLRKYGVDIKDSIYSDYVKIISDWGLQEYFKCQINYIPCTLTGSYIRFRGLDDSEKIKGLANFKRVVLEEISQFDEVDLKQIRKRLRGRINQQIIGLFNPISEEHWLKTNLFDVEDLEEIKTNTDITSKHINRKGNFVIYKVTYLNNKYIVGPHFIDQHTIDDFEKDKITDFNYYQIYGLGNWGKLRTGGEFWKNFNTNKHTTKDIWNEDFPIHLSWDENVNPHITCLVWQIIGKKAIQIDEICLPDPRNRVLDACNEFISRFPKERVKGLFIYGDRTSIKEDTKLIKGENFYTKIQEHLKDYRPVLRMQTVNPSVVNSGTFINEIYRENTQGIEIYINEKCKKSLFDYQYALEDSDGTIKKTKKTNPVTKVSYEEFGHCSDAKRYIITTAFATEYQDYLRGGKKTNISIGKSYSKSGY